MKYKKVIIILAVVALISGGIAVYTTYKNNQSIGETSGIILETFTASPDDPYVQLYKLLDMGITKEDGFTISPVPRSNKLEITIWAPREENLGQFKQWLVDNNFENIPEEKLIIH